MTTPIVEFTNPPVVEVAVGVGYPSMGPLGIALISRFWDEEVRAEFPGLQYQPPITVQTEQFGDEQPTFPQFRMLAGYPMPRLWALSEDGQDLLQIQADWFACNWRRVGPQDAYPRWAQRRDAFERWFTAFAGSLEHWGAPLGATTQCEVTYINHIEPNRVFQKHGDFERVFTVAAPKVGDDPDQLSFDIRSTISDAEGDKIGRLQISAAPGVNASGRPIYVLQLTVRGLPPNGDIMSFLDRGRELIDQAFVRVTTSDMQDIWGRTL